MSSSSEQPSPNPSSRRRYWLWTAAAGTLLVGGGAIYGVYFLRNRLIPIVEAQLTPILGRPIEIGDIESLGFSRLRLGSSELPPTESDPDRVKIDGIEVNYSLGEILRRRVVNADITVENPRIYIEQAADGGWLDLELNLPEPAEEPQELPVTIARIDATVRGTEIILVPRQPSGELGAEYRVEFPTLTAAAADDFERLEFDVAGNLEAGTLQATGRLDGPTGALEVTRARLQGVTLAQFLPLVGQYVPVTVEELGGMVAADLSLSAQLDDPLSTWKGDGTVSLADVVARVSPLQEAATAAGTLRLQGNTLLVERLDSQLGELQAAVTGQLNAQTGYDLVATVPATSIAAILAVVELEDPPNVGGEIAAEARIAGALAQPQIAATLTTPTPLAIDGNPLGTLQAVARLQDQQAILDGLNFAAAAGGEVLASGSYDPSTEAWSADVTVRDLDGELARPYLAEAPLTDLGRLNATAIGSGTLADLTGATAEGDFAWESTLGRLAASSFRLADRQLAADVNLDNVALQPFVPGLDPATEPLSGQLQLQATFPEELQLNAASLEQLRVRADGVLQAAGGSARSRLRFDRRQLAADLDLDDIALQPFIPSLAPEAEPLSGQLQLQATLPAEFTSGATLLEQLQAQAEGTVRAIGGSARIVEARARDGRWQAEAILNDLPLDTIALEGLPPELLQAANLSGRARADGSLARLDDLEAITVDASGRLDGLAEGVATVPELRLAAGRLQARAQTAGIRLDRLATAFGVAGLEAPTPVDSELEATVPLATLLGFSGLPALRELRADGQFNFARGLSVVTEPLDVAIAWNGERLDLVRASTASLQAQASPVPTAAASLQASGFVVPNLEATGLSLVGPYSLDVAAESLDLGRLPLPATAGTIGGLASFAGNLSGEGFRDIPPGQNLQDLQLQEIALAPQLGGTLALDNLRINNYAFEPRLAGSVRADLETGLDVSLQGTQNDVIALAATLAPPERPLPVEPQSLRVRLQEAEIVGTRAGDEFLVTLNGVAIQQFLPLLPPDTLPVEPIGGVVGGEVAANLATLGARGSLGIERPQVATFLGSALEADFDFDPDEARFTLARSSLQFGESDIQLDGEVRLDPEDWQNLDAVAYAANLSVPQARLQDALAALQIRTLADLNRNLDSTLYGGASDLAVAPPIAAEATLGDRLQRFATITQEIETQRALQAQAPLPPLSAIVGDVAVAASVSGQGLAPESARGEVRLDGQAWQWGNLGAQNVEARLELADGRLTVLPVTLASGDSSIALTGSTGLDFADPSLNFNLVVRDVPVESARNFVAFPPAIGVGGSFEANLLVAGSPQEPSATGEFAVANATINETPIERVGGTFTYSRSQLLFGFDGAISQDSDPVVASGTVPLQLPTSTIVPESDLLEVRVSLKDDALAFLDVLTSQQLRWGGGSADVELEVTGPFDVANFSLEALTGDGRVTLRDAQLVTAILSDPIEDINGDASFDLDRLTVDRISARLGGGEVTIAGALPFFEAAEDAQLTASIGELEINALEGLLKSNVEGTVRVGGTALATRIGGDVRVFSGALDLGNLPAAEEPQPPAKPLADPAAAVVPPDARDELAASLNLESELPANSCDFAADTPLLLEDFDIEVDPLFSVQIPVVASFFVEGGFSLDGPLLEVPKLCPEGVVELTRGTISIGSARFRLDNSERQTATFIPEQGLDPTLDVTMQAQVVETTRQSEIADPSQTEIADSSGMSAAAFGSAETIDVMARVQGRTTSLIAQQNLGEVLALESTPGRSESEILALIGQGALGGGSALGLASSLTGGLQAAVANALGLSEFSLFPIPVADSSDDEEDDDDGDGTTTLQLAAETGIDITNRLTFSVLAILTDQQPLLYSVRYRLSDTTSIRLLTDFEANDSATVNFDTRF